MRNSLIAGNWKMNLDFARARTLVDGLVAALGRASSNLTCELAIFPPYPYLSLAVERSRAADGKLAVGAQNCHAEDAGAFTGEVSPAMLADVGCSHVILGHSERRRDFAERDEQIAKRVLAALKHGLLPIVCIGETLEQRDGGETLRVVTSQVDGALAPLDVNALSRVVLAYEPVWAIGTGRTATPAQAVEVHAAIRARIRERFGAVAAQHIRILYGGSVTADNAAELLKQVEIDGALVGGASLKLESFLAIAAAARPRPLADG